MRLAVAVILLTGIIKLSNVSSSSPPSLHSSLYPSSFMPTDHHGTGGGPHSPEDAARLQTPADRCCCGE